MGFFVKKTTERLQVDPIECGAVSLGIVLEYYGHQATNLSLRNACCVSRRGAQASSIISGAAQFGLDAHAKKSLSLELRQIDTPAILFFDHSHFVVYEGYFLGHYYINDPALGRYKLTEKSFRRRYSNVFINLQKTTNFVSTAAHVKPHEAWWSKVFMSMLGVICGVSLGLLSSLLGMMLTNGAQHFVIVQGILPIIVGVLLSLMAGSLLVGLNIIKKISYIKIGSDNEFFTASILKTPLCFYDDIPFSSFSTSYVHSIEDNLGKTSGLLHGYFLAGFICAAGMIIVFVAPIIIFILLLLVFFYAMQKQLQKGSLAQQGSLSDEDFERACLLSLDMRAMGQGKLLRDGLLYKRLSLLPQFSLFNHVLSSELLVLLALALVCGAYLNFIPALWHQGVIDGAGISTILIMMFLIFIVLFVVSEQERDPGKSSAAMKHELAAQQDNAGQILEPLNSLNIIEVQDVGFFYRGESVALFDVVSLSIKQGMTILVDGPMKCGKSTLLKILAGILVPTSGCVRRQKSLRLALINEQTNLMNATIRDNVTLFNDRITDEKVVWALEQACALDVYYNRSLGLLAIIDHDGINLSASEKKRLLLASAIVQKPDVIFLDNFFDGLDKETSDKIFENLKRLNITVVFTAVDEHIKSQAFQKVTIRSHSVIIKERV